mmetsp:Transcript_15528/g.17252  ORF Transcript_15528/g.17252 Transcript_15528/m.17252 type:complete len:389 (-) Transcript_15528:97-1263(-)
MSGQLTCIACRLVFPGPHEQRSHYGTDFHRFNLKRKVAELPPLSKEVFEEKVNLLKHEESVVRVFSGYCGFCRKKFSSKNTYETHETSKKHLETRARLERSAAATGAAVPQMRAEVVEKAAVVVPRAPGQKPLKKAPVEPEKTDDELVALKLANARHFGEEDCLFCTHKAASLEASLQHMGAAHGFLVPDLEYLHDLRGLVEYLGQKIGIGNVCLYCDKMFNSAEAVMAHMVSLRHSKIRYDDDTEELEQFYDFSATWEGVAEDLGPGATPGKQEAAEVDERALMLATGKGVVEVVDGGYGLRLANGKIVGHRALVYLYRQRYRPPVERDGRVRAVIRNYRAIGWHTQHTKQSEKIRARALRNEKRWQLGVGVKANKLQPHFRRQVCF